MSVFLAKSILIGLVGTAGLITGALVVKSLELAIRAIIARKEEK